MADKLGVSLATIFKWENNKTRPPTHLRRRIVEFLGFDPVST
jgi:DNA-binding XRE family transcriptional regulator